MTTEHLTDTDIQLFVFDKEHCDARIAAHILHCPHCTDKARQYNSLAAGLAGQDKPAFAFDLTRVVMESLPPAKPKRRLAGPLVYLLVITVVAAILVPWEWLTKTGSLSTILIGTTMLCVLAFLLIDMYRIYQKQVKSLSI
jgi:hypothetical protein